MPAWLATAATLAAVSVAGDSSCPSPEEVNARLQPMLEEGGPEHRLELTSLESGAVQLRLLDAEGRSLAERELASAAPCSDRAAAVAAIVTAWEFDLRTRLPIEPAPPPPAPPPQIAPAPRWHVSLHAGALLAADAGSGAASAGVDLSRGTSAWALCAGAFGAALREVPLPPGTVRTWRAGLEVGGGRGFQGDGARAEARLLALAGVLGVAGSGFREDLSAVQPELGLGVSIRVAVGARAARPWVGGQVRAWPIERRLVVGGSAREATLARVEMFLGAGISVDLTER